jgi:hypothetical protein
MIHALTHTHTHTHTHTNTNTHSKTHERKKIEAASTHAHVQGEAMRARAGIRMQDGACARARENVRAEREFRNKQKEHCMR